MVIGVEGDESERVRVLIGGVGGGELVQLEPDEVDDADVQIVLLADEGLDGRRRLRVGAKVGGDVGGVGGGVGKFRICFGVFQHSSSTSIGSENNFFLDGRTTLKLPRRTPTFLSVRDLAFTFMLKLRLVG